MSLRKLALILAALTLSLGLVACGDDEDSGGGSGDSKPLSDNDYFREVNEAQTKFATAAGKLNLSNPSSPQAFGDSLDKLDPLIGSLVRELDGITPPEKVETQHDKLVTILRDYDAVLDKEKGALDSGNQERVRKSALAIAEGSTNFSKEFNAAITAINNEIR